MAKGRKILFVCTGNVYRSQIAEYLFNRMFRNIKAYSAGIDGLHAGRTVGQVWRVKNLESIGTDLKALGINILKNKCKLIKSKDIEAAERVFVMDDSQRKALAKMFPAFSGKVSELGKFAHLRNPDVLDITEEPDVGKTVAKIKKALLTIKKKRLLETL